MIRDVPGWWAAEYRRAGGDASLMPPVSERHMGWRMVGGEWLDPSESALLASCVRRQAALNAACAVLWWSMPALGALATLSCVSVGRPVIAGLSGAVTVLSARIVLAAMAETFKASVAWMRYARRLAG